MTTTVGLGTARRMWSLFEPLHVVTYFSPEARSAFEAGGLRGFWRGYFAGRAAPLGRVGPAPVTASFFGFAPAMVARALPDVWDRAAPEVALRVRSEGATAALSRLLADIDTATLDESAELLEAAVDGLDCSGRVLAAANAALPAPADGALARMWQATTVLREHRGDGHVAALMLSGVNGCEALVWRSSYDLERDHLQPNRGWTDEEWDAARAALVERGWVTTSGGPTEAGEAHHRAVEEATDQAATAPWAALGTAGTERLADLLMPMARTCAEPLVGFNPIGLPAPA